VKWTARSRYRASIIRSLNLRSKYGRSTDFFFPQRLLLGIVLCVAFIVIGSFGAYWVTSYVVTLLTVARSAFVQDLVSENTALSLLTAAAAA
jgi:hypothetical protein